MYKQTYNAQGELSQTMIVRLSDSAFIPFDPANTDYQAFLRWCEEGNTPLPADEPTQGE